MRTITRVAGFGLGLLAVFGAATGIGAAVGPIGSDATAGPHEGTTEAPPGPTEIPGGLAIAQDGYRLELASGQLPAEPGAPLRLRILGPDGKAVRDYAI